MWLKRAVSTLPVLALLACQAKREVARTDGSVGQVHEAVKMATEYIEANDISDVDLGSGKVINTTDEYWDVSFVVPEAVEAGVMPHARLFRHSGDRIECL